MSNCPATEERLADYRYFNAGFWISVPACTQEPYGWENLVGLFVRKKCEADGPTANRIAFDHEGDQVIVDQAAPIRLSLADAERG